MESRDSTYEVVQVVSSFSMKNGGPSIGAISIYKILRSKVSHNILVSLDGFISTRISRDLDVQPFKGNKVFRHLLMFLFISRMNKPNLIYIHGLHLPASWVTALIAKVRNIRYYVQLHGTLDPYEFENHRIRKYIFWKTIGKPFVRHANRVIVASRMELENAKLRISTNNFVVCPLGVDELVHTNHIHCLAKIQGLNSHFFQVPVSKRILFLGRLARKKQPDFLIRISSKLPDFHFVFAGPADFWTSESLLDLSQPDSRYRISFTGHVDSSQKLWLLKSCGLQVLPSLNENFAISVAESITEGLPMVVSSRVAASEFVREWNFGIVLDSFSETDWIEAIEKTSLKFDNSEFSKEIPTLAKDTFSWDKFVSTVILKESHQLNDKNFE